MPLSRGNTTFFHSSPLSLCHAGGGARGYGLELARSCACEIQSLFTHERQAKHVEQKTWHEIIQSFLGFKFPKSASLKYHFTLHLFFSYMRFPTYHSHFSYTIHTYTGGFLSWASSWNRNLVLSSRLVCAQRPSLHVWYLASAGFGHPLQCWLVPCIAGGCYLPRLLRSPGRAEVERRTFRFLSFTPTPRALLPPLGPTFGAALGSLGSGANVGLWVPLHPSMNPHLAPGLVGAFYVYT